MMKLLSKKIGEFKTHSHLLSPQNHLCEFYSTAESRIRSLCNFIVPGIIKGEAVIVIASFENIQLLKNTLILYAIDAEEVGKSGQLVMLDAEKTMKNFVRTDYVDDFLFMDFMTNLMEGISGNFPGVRAYGEMVDILYRSGRFDLTIQLEQLWAEMSLHYKFSLMCGYTADHFKDKHDHIKKLCSHHTHLVSKGILETI